MAMSVAGHQSLPGNTPLAELRTAELFVVCAARLWADGYRNGGVTPADLERGFAMAAVPAIALIGLCDFFETVAGAARRPLDLRCVRCPRLGTDEAQLLEMVCRLQHGRRDEAALLLADWLPPAAARIALTPLGWLAESLADSGLVVPPRNGNGPGPRAIPAMPCNDRGLQLVQ